MMFGLTFIAVGAVLLLEQADVWIHGHTHRVEDYAVGGCRVLSNPARDKGYDPTRCIELEVGP
jgi:hypothetical protein